MDRVRARYLDGFTLIELIVVIAIIGILAAIAVASYAEYKNRGKAIAAYEELSSIRTALFAYVAEFETLPPDTTIGVIPPGLQAYIPSSLFTEQTPLGGQYNWDGLPAHNPPGIAIEAPTAQASVLLRLDRMIDDGNLASGNFRQSGTHYQLIVQP